MFKEELLIEKFEQKRKEKEKEKGKEKGKEKDAETYTVPSLSSFPFPSLFFLLLLILLLPLSLPLSLSYFASTWHRYTLNICSVISLSLLLSSFSSFAILIQLF